MADNETKQPDETTPTAISLDSLLEPIRAIVREELDTKLQDVLRKDDAPDHAEVKSMIAQSIVDMRQETEKRFEKVRSDRDKAIAAMERLFVNTVNQINQTLETINQTIADQSRRMSAMENNMASIDGKLSNWTATVNQLTQRQDGQSRNLDQLRSEMRENRDDVDELQATANQHSNLLTGQGQMMRQFQTALYGDGTQESLFAMVREVRAELDGVVRWDTLMMGPARVREAFRERPVRYTGWLALAATVASGVFNIIDKLF